jgi:hypothetical protein
VALRIQGVHVDFPGLVFGQGLDTGSVIQSLFTGTVVDLSDSALDLRFRCFSRPLKKCQHLPKKESYQKIENLTKDRNLYKEESNKREKAII